MIAASYQTRGQGSRFEASLLGLDSDEISIIDVVECCCTVGMGYCR